MIIWWESGLGLGMRLGGMSVGVKLEERVGLRSGRKPTEPLIPAWFVESACRRGPPGKGRFRPSPSSSSLAFRKAGGPRTARALEREWRYPPTSTGYIKIRARANELQTNRAALATDSRRRHRAARPRMRPVLRRGIVWIVWI